MERQEIMNQFYTTDCNEEQRFESNHGKLEYLTTLKYINEYLKENDKILEVGAGTGRYSIYFAKQGYDVTSIEFVQNNLDVLKSKITDGMKIVAEQGDAVDLSRFDDETFNVTLVLGPLYHLFTKEDIDKAIKEAIRVTKKDGLIAMAYLTDESIMVSYVLKKHHLLDTEHKAFDENFRITVAPEEVFRSFQVDEFKEMMNNYPVSFIKQVAADGVVHHVKELFDDLSEEEFNVWLNYHLHTCERHDLMGVSNHVLYLCRKK